MKRPWGLRIRLIFQQLALTLVPLIIFAGLSQRSLVSSMRASLEDRMDAGLDKADRGLTLVLERYRTILDSFCADPMTCRMLEAYLGQEEAEADAARAWLEERMERLCGWDSLIGGMAVFFPEKCEVYYSKTAEPPREEERNGAEAGKADGGSGFFRIPLWMKNTEGEEQLLFSIEREAADGVRAVLYLEEQALQTAMEGLEEEWFLLEKDGTIVSAPRQKWLGENLYAEETRSQMEREEYWMKAVPNELTGCNVVILYSVSDYLDTLHRQRVLLALMCAALASLFIVYSFFVARPLILSVDNLLKAMKLAGKGDYSVRLSRIKGMPMEMKEISDGFNALSEQTKQLMERAGKAAMEQRNAEISALEAQIDPHFLYNTLDTINWKAIAKEEYEISEMLGDLADILRYAIKDAGGLTTLGQEIAWLKKYVRLQQEKLGCEIQIFSEVTEEAAGTAMHKMLLQPLVENSIRHGLPGIAREPVIVLAGKVEEGKLFVTVGDNGKGMQPRMLERLNEEQYHWKNHFGIENVRKRMRLYYGDEAGIYFRGVTDQYTRVTLCLPVREGEELENTNRGGRSAHPGWVGRDIEEAEPDL